MAATTTDSVYFISVDGGGIRGLVPLLLLKALERIVEANGQSAPAHKVFGAFAGTSTGAIVVSGLRSGLTVDELIRRYLQHRGEIFSPYKFGTQREIFGVFASVVVAIVGRLLFHPTKDLQQVLQEPVLLPKAVIKALQNNSGLLFGATAGVIGALKEVRLHPFVSKILRTTLAWTAFGSLPFSNGWQGLAQGILAGSVFGFLNGLLYSKSRLLKACTDAITYALYGAIPMLAQFNKHLSLCPSSGLTHNFSYYGSIAPWLQLIVPAMIVGMLDHTGILAKNISALFLAKYDRDQYDVVLQQILGVGNFFTGNNPGEPPLFIPAVRLVQREDRTYGAEFYMMATTQQPDQEGLRLFDAVAASSAAPTYFPPHQTPDAHFVDGGLVANNPTLAGMLWYYRTFAPGSKKLYLLSLGTASTSPKLQETLVQARAGLLPWVSPVIEVQGMADAIPVQLRYINAITTRLGAPLYEKFVRVHIENTSAHISLDGIHDENIDKILQLVANALQTDQNRCRTLLLEYASCILGVATPIDPYQNRNAAQILADLMPQGIVIGSEGCGVRSWLKKFWSPSFADVLPAALSSVAKKVLQLSVLASKSSWLSPIIDTVVTFTFQKQKMSWYFAIHSALVSTAIGIVGLGSVATSFAKFIYLNLFDCNFAAVQHAPRGLQYPNYFGPSKRLRLF